MTHAWRTASREEAGVHRVERGWANRLVPTAGGASCGRTPTATRVRSGPTATLPEARPVRRPNPSERYYEVGVWLAAQSNFVSANVRLLSFVCHFKAVARGKVIGRKTSKLAIGDGVESQRDAAAQCESGSALFQTGQTAADVDECRGRRPQWTCDASDRPCVAGRRPANRGPHRL